MEVCSAVDYSRGRDSGYSRLGYGIALLEEVVINSSIEHPELTQDWETDSWRHKEKLVHTRTQEKRSTDPTRDWPRISCEFPGVSGGGVGWKYPAAGLGH